jgi:hypothetical protein
MADNIAAICEPIFYKMWKPRRLTTLWASTASQMGNFTFPYSNLETMAILNAIT